MLDRLSLWYGSLIARIVWNILKVTLRFNAYQFGNGSSVELCKDLACSLFTIEGGR